MRIIKNTLLLGSMLAVRAVAQEQTQASRGFWDFRVGDLVLILAVVAAPLLALQAQWWLQLLREKRNRKLWIFKTLMSTRGARISPEHVTALNSIEVEFHEKDSKNKAIVAAWRKYLDHLDTPSKLNAEGQPDPAEQSRWTDESNNLFIALLYQIALALDYDFDEVLLKRGFYAPRGHDELETDQLLLRKGLLRVLYGTRSIGVAMPPPSEDEISQQERIRQLTIQYLEGKTAVPVKVIQETRKS